METNNDVTTECISCFVLLVTAGTREQSTVHAAPDLLHHSRCSSNLSGMQAADTNA